MSRQEAAEPCALAGQGVLPRAAAASNDESLIAAAGTTGAAAYDEAAGHGRLSPPEHDAWVRPLLGRIIDLSRPRRVLDVGTGTGFPALLLAELGHDVVGIGPSEPMLAKARAKTEAAGLDVELRHGDASMLPRQRRRGHQPE